MSTVGVYGASDDLVEIDGDIREEFGAYDSDPIKLGFSDGTVLTIRYDEDGNWKIGVTVRGLADVVVTSLIDREEGSYSDKAVLTGDVKWVIKGTEWAQ